MQGLLTHVIVHQPDDPIGYFHEEIGKMKKEMEESNVSRPFTCPARPLHQTPLPWKDNRRRSPQLSRAYQTYFPLLFSFCERRNIGPRLLSCCSIEY